MVLAIDNKVNKIYLFNEPNLSVVAKAYIKKYLNNGGKSSQLKILCTTSYMLAMKYLLDSSPLTKDYSKIVNVSTNSLNIKEMEIAKQFLFNFTPILTFHIKIPKK